MKPETERRYRFATEAKIGPINDERWQAMLDRYLLVRRAHYLVNRALERGEIQKYTCAIQGCESEDTEAHHPNYYRPLSVVWLCRSHHKKEHILLRSMNPDARYSRNQRMLEFADLCAECEDEVIEESSARDVGYERFLEAQETHIEYDPEYLNENQQPENQEPKPQCPHCHGTGIAP